MLMYCINELIILTIYDFIKQQLIIIHIMYSYTYYCNHTCNDRAVRFYRAMGAKVGENATHNHYDNNNNNNDIDSIIINDDSNNNDDNMNDNNDNNNNNKSTSIIVIISIIVDNN